MLILNDLCWTLSSYGRGRVALKLWVAPDQTPVLRRTLADHNIDVTRCARGGRVLTITAPRSILRILGLLGVLEGSERRSVAEALAEYCAAHEEATPGFLERREHWAEVLLSRVGHNRAPPHRADPLPGAPVRLRLP